MVENPGKRGGHVFIGHGLTAGAVLQDKGIITLATQYIRQRKPFVQRTDIAKASTRKNQGKGRTGLASVIKQAGSLLLFPLRIERVKHGLARSWLIYHAVQSQPSQCRAVHWLCQGISLPTSRRGKRLCASQGRGTRCSPNPVKAGWFTMSATVSDSVSHAGSFMPSSILPFAEHAVEAEKTVVPISKKKRQRNFIMQGMKEGKTSALFRGNDLFLSVLMFYFSGFSGP